MFQLQIRNKNNNNNKKNSQEQKKPEIMIEKNQRKN